MDRVVHPAKRISGTLKVPGDKSISHRALMLGAIAEGQTRIENLSDGRDVESTIRCLQHLGVTVTREGAQTVVDGNGLTGLRKPAELLDAGNSGTTVRLLSGILAGQDFTSTITGDASLRQRPMARIVDPLREMGAEIEAIDGKHLPLQITGRTLKAIHYDLPVASAQVKSCVLFAGLYPNGTTTVSEEFSTRDHSERMLQTFGAIVDRKGSEISVCGGVRLTGQGLFVPGDLSSSAFFVAAAVLLPDSELRIENVGLNPTRKAFLSVLSDMGASIEIRNLTTVNNELLSDIFVTSSKLNAVRIDGQIIPQLIDEIPVLALLATQAEGRTEIRGARELKYKESDRLRALSHNLGKMGAQIEEIEDGLIIDGPVKLKPAELESFHDHRIAMVCTIAGLVALEKPSVVKNTECADVSFPGFFEKLREVAVA